MSEDRLARRGAAVFGILGIVRHLRRRASTDAPPSLTFLQPTLIAGLPRGRPLR